MATEKSELIVVEPIETLFNTKMCFVCIGVGQVQPSQKFRILVGNMGNRQKNSNAGQTTDTAKEQSTKLEEDPFRHSEVLGATFEKLYRKW